MHTTNEKLCFLDGLIERSQDDEEIAEILFEIREDVAAFAVNASRLMKTEDKLREAREKELVRNETLKQAFMNLLKDSGVYDAILEDAKEVAARKASKEKLQARYAGCPALSCN